MKNAFWALAFIVLSSGNLLGTSCVEPTSDLPMGDLVQCENFDSYSTGGLSAQSTEWIQKQGAADGQVIYSSGSKALEIKDQTGSDLPGVIYLLKNRRYKRYRVSFNLFVDRYKNGFFTLQHDERNYNSNESARFYFDQNGEGRLEIPNQSDVSFKYINNGKNRLMLMVDLETKKVEFWVNDFYVHSWDFTSGFTRTENVLGGLAFSAKSSSSYKVDNICVWESGFSIGGLDSLIFRNNGEVGYCMDNGWTISSEDARKLLYISSEWYRCETVCDLAPPFIQPGDQFEEDFKLTELSPGFLRAESCISDNYSGWVPKRLFAEVFMIYHREDGPLRFEGFWSVPDIGSLQGYLFECVCPDNSTDPSCEQTEQKCLGAFENDTSFLNLPSGFYYLVMVSPDEGTFGFSISPNAGNCPSDKQNIECGTTELGNLFGRTNKFDLSGGVDAYSQCYNGSRAFEGSDTVFALQVLIPQTVDISLNYPEGGLFVFNEFCAETCIASAEANSSDFAEINDLFLLPGSYFIIVDSDTPDLDREYELKVNCVEDEDFNLFLGTRTGSNCPVNIGAIHEVNLPIEANSSLLSKSPFVNFLYFDEGGNLQYLDTASLQFNGNEVAFQVPGDQSGDPDKCSYRENDAFEIRVAPLGEYNLIKIMDAVFLSDENDGVTAEGLFIPNQVSKIEKLTLQKTISFLISPSENIKLSGTGNTEARVTINSALMWDFSKDNTADWLTVRVVNTPRTGGFYKDGATEIIFTATPNSTSLDRKANVKFNLKDEPFELDLSVNQLARPVVSTNRITVDNFIQIYPNPASESVFIKFEKNIFASKIFLLNSVGKLVSSVPITNSSLLQYDLSNRAPGVYFLKIITSSGQFCRRIIINN